MSKKNMGSSIDDFLKEEGIFEEAQAQAVKEVVAWQLTQDGSEAGTADRHSKVPSSGSGAAADSELVGGSQG